MDRCRGTFGDDPSTGFGHDHIRGELAYRHFGMQDASYLGLINQIVKHHRCCRTANKQTNIGATNRGLGDRSSRRAPQRDAHGMTRNHVSLQDRSSTILHIDANNVDGFERVF